MWQEQDHVGTAGMAEQILCSCEILHAKVREALQPGDISPKPVGQNFENLQKRVWGAKKTHLGIKKHVFGPKITFLTMSRDNVQRNFGNKDGD